MNDELHESIKVPSISDHFVSKVLAYLSRFLEAKQFYFSVCPDSGTVEFSVVAGYRCNLCGHYHAWLTVSREEAYELSNKRIPPSVDKFIKEQLKSAPRKKTT